MQGGGSYLAVYSKGQLDLILRKHQTRRHGAYTFDISGTDFDPADLNYSAGEGVLNLLLGLIGGPDRPPAGCIWNDVHMPLMEHTFDISGAASILQT